MRTQPILSLAACALTLGAAAAQSAPRVLHIDETHGAPPKKAAPAAPADPAKPVEVRLLRAADGAVPLNLGGEIVRLQEAAQQGFLGVMLSDGEGGGAGITSLVDGAPAGSAGLKAGDRIVAVDGQELANAAALTAAVRGKQPGTVVHLTIARGDKTLQREVKLGVRGEGGVSLPGALDAPEAREVVTLLKRAGGEKQDAEKAEKKEKKEKKEKAEKKEKSEKNEKSGDKEPSESKRITGRLDLGGGGTGGRVLVLDDEGGEVRDVEVRQLLGDLGELHRVRFEALGHGDDGGRGHADDDDDEHEHEHAGGDDDDHGHAGGQEHRVEVRKEVRTDGHGKTDVQVWVNGKQVEGGDESFRWVLGDGDGFEFKDLDIEGFEFPEAGHGEFKFDVEVDAQGGHGEHVQRLLHGLDGGDHDVFVLGAPGKEGAQGHFVVRHHSNDDGDEGELQRTVRRNITQRIGQLHEGGPQVMTVMGPGNAAGLQKRVKELEGQVESLAAKVQHLEHMLRSRMGGPQGPFSNTAPAAPAPPAPLRARVARPQGGQTDRPPQREAAGNDDLLNEIRNLSRMIERLEQREQRGGGGR